MLQEFVLRQHLRRFLAPSLTIDQRRLRDLAGVGRSIEADLHKVGVKTVAQLAASDGDDLFQRLCAKTHSKQDPCVLDTFRCAIAQARNPQLPIEQRNWWWWSRQRKQQSL
jgi:Pathogenicity locus